MVKTVAMHRLAYGLLAMGAFALACRALETPRVGTRKPELTAPVLKFHASRSGKRTLDRDALGGNPFASAFIELMSTDDLTLATLADGIEARTAQHSRGFQTPQIPDGIQGDERAIKLGDRVALILVVTNYADPTVMSLAGAKFDADRLNGTLQSAGFAVTMVVDPTISEAKSAIQAFASVSRTADVAIAYTTGHGFERHGVVRLIFGAFRTDRTHEDLREQTLPIDVIGEGLMSSGVNLLFYAGCRDDPFAPKVPQIIR